MKNSVTAIKVLGGAMAAWVLAAGMQVLAQERDGAAAGALPGRESVVSRFKNVTQAEPGLVDQMAPELEKQAGQIRGVMNKYKARTQEALPELQADMNTIASSLANVATNISDEKIKAKWSEFQDGVLADLQDGALDEITATVFARLKLDDSQVQQVRPAIKDHFTKLMGIIKEGQAAGLDGIPALVSELKAQVGAFDAQVGGVLKPEQMEEMQKARSEMRTKLFGQMEDRQVAEMLALVGNADQVKELVEQDVKARFDLAEEAADKGKEAVSQLKDGLGRLNGDTRSKLKGLVPDADLDKLDATNTKSDAKLLERLGQ